MSKDIAIRIINHTDFDLLKRIELDLNHHQYSNLNEVINEEILFSFITSNHDIYLYKQLKFTILFNNERVGFIDLYDVDFKENKAGIGIIIIPEFRRKKIAINALHKLINWCKKTGINYFFAEINKSNLISVDLFQKAGFYLSAHQQDILLFEKIEK
jgi:diamine N-acetyltransferase